jgi:hypothetical protein
MDERTTPFKWAGSQLQVSFDRHRGYSSTTEVMTFKAGIHAEEIDMWTFSSFPCLKSIHVPTSVVHLSAYAFACRFNGIDRPLSFIERITFEPGSELGRMYNNAFSGCYFLKSICIPAGIDSYKTRGACFLDCGLENIEFESGSDFRRHDNFVLSSDSRVLVRYFGQESEVRIPDTVRIINAFSFGNCHSVRRVTFGLSSRLERLEYQVFPPRDPRLTLGKPEAVWDPSPSQLARLRAVTFERYSALTSLESIVFPSTLKFIGERCFSGCHKLVEVIFAANSILSEIEDGGFVYCISLPSLCLPSSIKQIGEGCFDGCRSMSDLMFSTPSKLQSLTGLPPLTSSIDIPDSVQDLSFHWDGRSGPGHLLNFGRESKIARIDGHGHRAFLNLSSKTLKFARSNLEADSANWNDA